MPPRNGKTSQRAFSYLFFVSSVAYDRLPSKYRTLTSFLLSAVWHGFFPGYYVMFLSSHVCLLVQRKVLLGIVFVLFYLSLWRMRALSLCCQLASGSFASAIITNFGRVSEVGNCSAWATGRASVLPTLRFSREFGFVFCGFAFFLRLAGCLFSGVFWLKFACFLGLFYADFCIADRFFI